MPGTKSTVQVLDGLFKVFPVDYTQDRNGCFVNPIEYPTIGHSQPIEGECKSFEFLLQRREGKGILPETDDAIDDPGMGILRNFPDVTNGGVGQLNVKVNHLDLCREQI
jgi:hypothetical protein